MRLRRFRTVALLVREWSVENDRLRRSFFKPTSLHWDWRALGASSVSEPSSGASNIVSRLVGLTRDNFLFRYKLIMSFSVMSEGFRLENFRGRLIVRRLIPWSKEPLASGRVRRVRRWEAEVDDGSDTVLIGAEVDANREGDESAGISMADPAPGPGCDSGA